MLNKECKRMVGREHEESFSQMNWHLGRVQTIDSLKVLMCRS